MVPTARVMHWRMLSPLERHHKQPASANSAAYIMSKPKGAKVTAQWTTQNMFAQSGCAELIFLCRQLTATQSTLKRG